MLFGYTDALQLRAGGGAVHALLIVIAIVLLAYGVCQLRKGARTGRHRHRACVGRAVRALVLHHRRGARATSPGMTPYVATLLVLAFAAQRLRMPAADGLGLPTGEAG